MSKLAITGVTLPDGSRTDLFIESGHLVDQHPLGATTIDADGLIALPGLVDIHTHLREPGREDAETVESGSRAAARGGFTAVFAMANTQPVTDTAENAEHVLALGAAANNCQVFPIGAITKKLAGRELAELGLMHRSRARVSVFSDDGHCVMDASLMRRAFEWVKPFDGVLAQHVCHVSTAEGVDVLRWAKKRGIRVTAEATPHHLYLTTPEVVGYDTTFKVNPPLRTDEHVEAVRAALADGTIDAVATDHAPHAPQDKDHAFVDARPGMLGLEQALAVVMETMVSPGRLTWQQVADRMSHTPARIGKATGQGRPLSPGEPANLVLIDPKRRATVDRNDSASISHNNPYHGRDLPDPVEMTLWNGRITHKR